MRQVIFLLICLGSYQTVTGQNLANITGAHNYDFSSFRSLPPKNLTYFDFNRSNFQKETSLLHYKRINFVFKRNEEKLHPHLSPYAIAIPSLAIGYGFWALENDELIEINTSTRGEILEDHPHFLTNLDDYLQFSPAAAVIGLNLFGIHGKHSFRDELGVYAISSLLMISTVHITKQLTHEQRPDSSGYNSFPSGHTATVFAAAEWLRIEYGDRHPWIGIAGYTVATATGVLRLYNNRHWVSDVVAGAAIGFLSTRLAYFIYPWIKNHLFRHKSRRHNELFTTTK